LNIDISNDSGIEIDELDLISLSDFVVNNLHVHPSAELSVLITGEARMSQLHLQWMDLDGPTDVLSFPMDEVRPDSWSGDLSEDAPVLGDLVLCPTIAATQAAAAGHSTGDELMLLTAHGMLHLLGYDHAQPAEELEMFALQADLLSRWRDQR
jgi:probable rRNA maturation factor